MCFLGNMPSWPCLLIFKLRKIPKKMQNHITVRNSTLNLNWVRPQSCFIPLVHDNDYTLRELGVGKIATDQIQGVLLLHLGLRVDRYTVTNLPRNWVCTLKPFYVTIVIESALYNLKRASIWWTFYKFLVSTDQIK